MSNDNEAVVPFSDVPLQLNIISSSAGVSTLFKQEDNSITLSINTMTDKKRPRIYITVVSICAEKHHKNQSAAVCLSLIRVAWKPCVVINMMIMITISAKMPPNAIEPPGPKHRMIAEKMQVI